LTLDDAFTLFNRLGTDVRSLSPKEFTQIYFALAKRYHPDIGNQDTEELMANINAARKIILDSYRHDALGGAPAAGSWHQGNGFAQPRPAASFRH
jgi:DnaJ-class molecular chaperone